MSKIIVHRLANDELYHHGILKQKWGIRNGPPYPLAISDRSASERRANGSRYTKSAKKRDIIDADYREVQADNGKPRNKISEAANAGKAVSKTLNDADKLAQNYGRNHHPEGDDLSNKSTEELKQEIDRMRTEQQYHDLRGDQINKGAEHIHEILQNSAIATDLIVSGLTAAALIGVLTGKIKIP